jgi:hypothetical protein
MFIRREIVTTLLLSCIVSVVDAQPPRGGRGRGGFNIALMLVADSDVQEELEIEGKQVEMLEALRSDLFSQVRGRRGSRRDQPSREHVATVTEKLMASVLDPAQARRLHQLEVQFEGVRALDRERVVAALDLSDAQKESIAAYATAHQVRSPEDLQTMVAEMLSQDQLEKWASEIHGEEFGFSEEIQGAREFFTRRGFRGRGAPGPERGRDESNGESRPERPRRPE